MWFLPQFYPPAIHQSNHHIESAFIILFFSLICILSICILKMMFLFERYNNICKHLVVFPSYFHIARFVHIVTCYYI